MILLQTLSTDSFSAADSLGMDAAGQNIGLLALLIKGGYMMIPLYLLFILAIFIIFSLSVYIVLCLSSANWPIVPLEIFFCSSFE